MGVPTKISTRRLGKRIGAEVTIGHKAALIHDSTAREVLDALEQHNVLVFRELHLDDAAQVAFSRKLGEVLILEAVSRGPTTCIRRSSRSRSTRTRIPSRITSRQRSSGT